MRYLSLLIISFLLLNCAQETPDSTYNPENDTLRYEGEKHFRNIQQLTLAQITPKLIGDSMTKHSSSNLITLNGM